MSRKKTRVKNIVTHLNQGLSKENRGVTYCNLIRQLSLSPKLLSYVEANLQSVAKYLREVGTEEWKEEKFQLKNNFRTSSKWKGRGAFSGPRVSPSSSIIFESDLEKLGPEWYNESDPDWEFADVDPDNAYVTARQSDSRGCLFPEFR
jgi:hypothetical protein